LRERETERVQEGGEAKGEGEGSQMWGSIPGPGDHDLSRSQTLNHLSHPRAPPHLYF